MPAKGWATHKMTHSVDVFRVVVLYVVIVVTVVEVFHIVNIVEVVSGEAALNTPQVCARADKGSPAVRAFRQFGHSGLLSLRVTVRRRCGDFKHQDVLNRREFRVELLGGPNHYVQTPPLGEAPCCSCSPWRNHMHL